MPHRSSLDFLRRLLTLGSGASPWLIAAFVLGLVAVGVFSNLLYGLVSDLFTMKWLNSLLVLLTVLILIGLAYAAYRYDLARALRPMKVKATFDESKKALPHAGLIWMLSRGNLDLPLFAIKHHYVVDAGVRLQHLWVLCSPGSQDLYEQLRNRLEELGWDEVQLHTVHLEDVSIEATYRAVDRIYSGDRAGLAPAQIVADLTGGFKTMTAGMVYACLPYGRPLEYVESDRNPVTGEYIEGTQRVMAVGVDFEPSK